MKRRSSLRGTLAPMPSCAMCAPPSLSDAAALGHGRYRLDDVVIAGTAAQIAVEIRPDGGLVRMRDAPEQIDRRHDHPGRTEPALQRMMLVKRRLHGMELVPFGQPLDGRNLGAGRLRGHHGAGLNCAAIQMDYASPALPGIAPHMCPG